MDILASQERAAIDERAILDNEVARLTQERDGLVLQMNDLTSKYEIFVTSMTRERDDQTVENANHVRLLSSKLMWLILDRVHRRHMKEAFSSLEENSSVNEK